MINMSLTELVSEINISRIIRSGRRTLSMEMTADGLVVRIPYYTTQKEIEKFLLSHRAWIEKAEKKVSREIPPSEILTREEIEKLADKAVKLIPERVAYYAPKIGVTYGRITIRNQRSRWGSCSSKGNLNFNCLLMLTPLEVIDSVVVHELCHRKEMNHSKAFYAEIQKVFPDYSKWNRWLKEHGPGIMRRMTG